MPKFVAPLCPFDMKECIGRACVYAVRGMGFAIFEQGEEQGEEQILDGYVCGHVCDRHIEGRLPRIVDVL